MRNRFCFSGRHLLSIFVGLTVLAGSGPARAQQAVPAAPGRLIDLGGYRLHLNCTGRGKPTVVLSAGAGDFSFDWALVQPELARFTRVCSYDRSGEAWSDLGPKPRTADQEVFDLERLLARGGQRGPYVLVGQSLGGMVARLFASAYPRETAGLVLVDAFSEDAQLSMNGKLVRVRETARDRQVPDPHLRADAADRLTGDEKRAIQDFMTTVGKPTIEAPFDRLPASVQTDRLWALSLPGHYAGGDDYLAEIAARLHAEAEATSHPLGDLPVIVLTRTRDEYPPDQVAVLSREHREQQQRLASLSSRDTLIVVPDAGHHIQLDQPAAVVDAIHSLVEDLRRHPPAR
jgi:pimeloyl-ACP methyl ester carboxylesterase